MLHGRMDATQVFAQNIKKVRLKKGILGAHRKLELPRLDEGFDRLFYVEIGDDGQFLVKEWSDEV